MKRKTHKQMLADLMRQNVITPEARARHTDIEEAVEAAGGSRGGLRDAAA